MKYRKKAIVIEATKWMKNGDHPKDNVFRPFEDTGAIPTEPREGEIVRYFRRPDVNGLRSCEFCDDVMNKHGWIDTLEGGHIVCPGDWIITGVKGENYPCKPNIFELSYDPAE